MQDVKVYFRLLGMGMRSGLQYKGWPLMLVQVLAVVVSDPLMLIFMFQRFGSIGEWSVDRLLLIYAMAITGLGLAEGFFRGFDYFPNTMIQGGGLDRLLLQPRSLFALAAGSAFHLHRFSRVVSGIVAMIWCLVRLNVAVTFAGVIVLIGALMGGMVLYAGVFVLTSGISFFTVKATGWIYLFSNTGQQAAQCPPPYQPKLLRAAFTFIVPVLWVSYYPASTVCGWGEPAFLGWLALPVGLVFFALASSLFRLGLRHYQSTGS